jgi:inner membrane protein
MEPPTPQSPFDRSVEWIKQSITLKLFAIGFLMLLLLIPLEMVQDLIWERERLQNQVVNDISSTWAKGQLLYGPILSIPYDEIAVVENHLGENNEVKVRKTAHFLPEYLSIDGKLDSEKRHRGIYEVTVYSSQNKISGFFNQPDLSHWPGQKEVFWDQSTLSYGLSDLRGVQEIISIDWNSSNLSFNPGSELAPFLGNGVSVPVPLDISDSNKKYNFDISLELNGSGYLLVVPLGKETKVNLSGNWPDPKFSGAFLTDTSQVDATSFEAEWKILNLNRSFPQQFTAIPENIDQSAFGVELLIPVDEYQKNTRSAKYAILLISLTFIAFFFIQLLNKIRVHPIQYILVGLALCLFYLLLLSLSEHIGFYKAYLIAALAVILQITFYVKALLKSWKLSAWVFGIIGSLYAFIYIIIQEDEYSLLMGSIGLFLVLGLMMYLSRKVDWYSLRKSE